jgi:hypothetical protein
MFYLCVFADGILVVSAIDDLGIYSGDCLCHLCNRQIDRSPPTKKKTHNNNNNNNTSKLFMKIMVPTAKRIPIGDEGAAVAAGFAITNL